MNHGSALKIISERLKNLEHVKDNDLTNQVHAAFEGLNYIQTCYDNDEFVRKALIDIITYIKYIEQQLIKIKRG